MRKGYLLFAAILPVACAISAESFQATVTAVMAGDMIQVNRDETPQDVRLYGVDAPEAGQPFAKEAKAYVTEKALGKEATVQVVAEDDTGKTVGIVILPDYLNLNYTLVEQGLAWWDQQNAPADRKLTGLAAKAISARRGLWASPAPLAPHDYRQSQGAPQFRYGKGAEPEPVAEAPGEKPDDEPEVKTLAAKGDAVYTGGGYVVDAGSIKFDKDIDAATLMMQHMPTVSMDANGKPAGLAVPNIGQIPYATQLGFQNGDIITGVNGQPIRNIGQIYGMVQQFQNAKSINVSITRNGRPENIRINLP